MRLTMKERKRVADMSAGRYRQAQKKEKTVILNKFTSYGRSYPLLFMCRRLHLFYRRNFA